MSLEPESHGTDGDRSTRDGASPVGATGTSLILAPLPQPAIGLGLQSRHLVWGAGFLLALGLGTIGVATIRSGTTAPPVVQAVQADASTQVLHRLEEEVARLKGSVDTLRVGDATRQDESMRGLRKSVDNLKQEIDQVKTTDGITLAQLSTKIDKTDHDPNPKLAEIMARLEKLDRDPAAKNGEGAAQKLAEVQSRLERVERQIASPAVTGTIPAAPRPLAAAPVQTPPLTLAAIPAPLPRPVAKQDVTLVPAADPKAPPAKAPTVAGWVLRDVYDGMALVEARGGDLREISPGEYLPGVGEVRSIERRGRSWVVLTSRGVIENSTW